MELFEVLKNNGKYIKVGIIIRNSHIFMLTVRVWYAYKIITMISASQEVIIQIFLRFFVITNTP